MFANFTQETCTGTGDTLTLTGNTAGNRPFSRGFSDGDLVGYALHDSGGVITCSGVGTYNGAGNTITRNDTENDNGAVTDKNPSTNIALSAGTHTIGCDVVSSSSAPVSPSMPSKFLICAPSTSSSTFTGFTANTLYFVPFELKSPINVNSIDFNVIAASAGSFTRLGIYSQGSDGFPHKLLISSDEFDTGVNTGDYSDAVNFKLNPGIYFSAMISSGAIDVRGIDRNSTNNSIIGDNNLVNTGHTICELTASYSYSSLPLIAPASNTTIAHNPPYVRLQFD